MKNTFQEVASLIADNLKDCNKELKFKYDANSVSFNLLDGNGTGEGCKYIHHQNKEDETVPLDHKQSDETFNTTVSAASFENDTYVFLSSNPLDIPIAHAIGCNYLIAHNDAVLSDYEKQLSSIDVCLTTKSEAEIKTLHKIFDLNMDIIILDFKEACPEYSKKDSLFTLAEKIQETGKDGIDAISKYMYQTYKKNTCEREAVGKTPEDSKTPDSRKTTNNKSSVGLKNNATETGFSVPQNNIEILPINMLINDKKYQSRVSEDQSAIDDLAVAYINDEEIPPITVVNVEDDKYIITDGHHRYAGAKKAGIEKISCNVTVGTELDAFKLSLGANNGNKALKRTNEDKRNAVISAIRSNEFKENSNRQLAEICKVSSSLIDKIFLELQSPVFTSSDTSAHMGTLKSKKPESFESEHSSSAHMGSETTVEKKTHPKQKHYTETISNEHVLLSVKWKSRPLNEEVAHVFLTDLQSFIDDYISDFKEAI